MLFLLPPLAAWLVASGIAVDVSLVAGGIVVAWIMCHSYNHPAEAAFLTAGLIAACGVGWLVRPAAGALAPVAHVVLAPGFGLNASDYEGLFGERTVVHGLELWEGAIPPSHPGHQAWLDARVNEVVTHVESLHLEPQNTVLFAHSAGISALAGSNVDPIPRCPPGAPRRPRARPCSAHRRRPPRLRRARAVFASAVAKSVPSRALVTFGSSPKLVDGGQAWRVLCTTGEHDQLVKPGAFRVEATEALARARPGQWLRFGIVPGAGHFSCVSEQGRENNAARRASLGQPPYTEAPTADVRVGLGLAFLSFAYCNDPENWAPRGFAAAMSMVAA